MNISLRQFRLLNCCKNTMALSFTGILLVSCSSYQVTLNNNVLYTPGGKPATPSLVSDPDLQGCLNQLLANAGNDPEKITLLACPAAGIKSLAGIGALPNLEQLELSDNEISDLSPLLDLVNLRVLGIRNNRISAVSTLLALPIIRFIALEGNNSIPCKQLDALEKKIGRTLSRPERCQA